MNRLEFNLPRLAALIPMLLWSLDIMSSGRVLPIGYIAAVLVLMVVLLWRPVDRRVLPQQNPAAPEARTVSREEAWEGYDMPDRPRARRV